MRILCAMDGSESAILAGRWVRSLPLSDRHEVLIVSVVIPEDGTDGKPASSRSAETLEGTAARVRVRIERGHAADRILHVAEAERVDWIAMGSRGLTGITHLLLGSVAERVARHASCPVVVARSDRAPQRILLGTDGSEGAELAARWLREFPGVTSAEVIVVSVLPHPEDLGRAYRLQFPAASGGDAVDRWVQEQIADGQRRVERKVENFAESGIQAVSEVRHGDAAQELLEAARNHGADLIVVGAHGLSAIERFFMGSISERVLRQAACSVAVVR